MAVVTLTDSEFMLDWMRYFGPTHGTSLMGWLVLCAAFGNELTARDLRDNGLMSERSRYRNVHDILAYIENLRERGLVEADEPAEPAEPLYRLGRMVAALG
jgi:hypothetical protein